MVSVDNHLSLFLKIHITCRLIMVSLAMCILLNQIIELNSIFQLFKKLQMNQVSFSMYPEFLVLLRISVIEQLVMLIVIL